jgi:hypothetical protein
MKKILLIIVGIIGLKIFNSIGFLLLSSPGEGVVIWKAFLPPLLGCIFLAICLVKGNIFFDYQKKLTTIQLKRLLLALYISFGVLLFTLISNHFLNSNNTFMSYSSKDLTLVCKGEQWHLRGDINRESPKESKIYTLIFKSGKLISPNVFKEFQCEWTSEKIMCKDNEMLQWVNVDRLSGDSHISYMLPLDDKHKAAFFFNGICEPGKRLF